MQLFTHPYFEKNAVKYCWKQKKRKGINVFFSVYNFTFSQMQLEASSREIFTYVLVSFWLPPHFLYSLEPIWCFKLGVEMPYWTKATNSDFFFFKVENKEISPSRKPKGLARKEMMWETLCPSSPRWHQEHCQTNHVRGTAEVFFS